MPDTLIASFVLRFVLDQEAGSATNAWRGVIRHVQTNDELHFSGMKDALVFIQRFIEIPDSDFIPPSLPENGES